MEQKSSGMGKEIRTGYTFDDILLIPGLNAESRRGGDTRTEFVHGVPLQIPVIVSPMMQMRSRAMVTSVLNAGGGFILDRFFTLDERVSFYKSLVISILSAERLPFAFAIGVRGGLDDAKYLYDKTGVKIFCIDVANGATSSVFRLITDLKTIGFKSIGGNVVTADAAKMQLLSGVDALRVGLGNGSICKTRIETGFGVPQFTALQDVASVSLSTFVPIISDGGVGSGGDVVKALVAGASSVILGRQFAACEDSVADVYLKDGKRMKEYFGMASNRAADALGVERFLSEGVEDALIPIDEASHVVLERYKRHIQAGMAYAGAKNIEELRRTEYMLVTQNGVRESHPHHLVGKD